MASKSFHAGDTFWIRSDINVEEPHLYFVLTSPCEATPAVWIVNMTSTPYDSTVVLEPGDHPAVDHASYVWYKKATKASCGELEKAFNLGLATSDQSASAQLLKTLREGFLKSKQVDFGVKRDFAAVLGREAGIHPDPKPNQQNHEKTSNHDKQP